MRPTRIEISARGANSAILDSLNETAKTRIHLFQKRSFARARGGRGLVRPGSPSLSGRRALSRLAGRTAIFYRGAIGVPAHRASGPRHRTDPPGRREARWTVLAGLPSRDGYERPTPVPATALLTPCRVRHSHAPTVRLPWITTPPIRYVDAIPSSASRHWPRWVWRDCSLCHMPHQNVQCS